MSALRFGGQLFAAVVAGGSIGPSMMQIAECAKEATPPQFDPEALERGAKALREITSSTHAKSVFELSKKQEETKVQELKKDEAVAQQYAKQLEVEREKVHWEEMQKTNQQNAQTKAQMARYEDELARKRMEAEHEGSRNRNAELVTMQEEATRRQETHRRVVEEQIQSERRKTAEQEADVERETLRQKALFEAEGRIREARENEDVNRRQMMVRLKAEQEKALELLNTTLANVGTGLRDLSTDPKKATLLVGSLTALAAGVYGAREGTKLSAKLLERYLGQPALVRETSKRGYGPSAMLARLKGGQGTPSTMGLAPVEGLGEVVLEPQLDGRVRQLAAATANWKMHGAPFQNAMFYGPPGTGKTLAARQLAKFSGMDYAIMTGGDVAPLGAQAVTRLHELFDWAEASNKGLILFIDEADAFLGVRGREGSSEGVRAAMNALLSRTGSQSTKIALVLATNRPADLDAAIHDRMDELMEFGLPGVHERERIFRAHLYKYLTPPTSGGMFSKAQDPVAMEGIDEGVLNEVAMATEGFSGRQLAKLAAGIQGTVFGSKEAVLTPELLREVMQIKVEEHKVRERLAKGETI